MILSRMLQPDILSAIGRAGHGSGILIADGNYPISTHSPAGATKVFLNLRRGLVRVVDVLEVLRDTIPIERAIVMAPRDGEPAPIHQELFGLLSSEAEKRIVPKAEFYAEASHPETVLVIATGEEQRFANILVTIGVVKPGAL